MKGLCSHSSKKLTRGFDFHAVFIDFFFRDSQIAAKSGSDCVIYLSFQRHLVLLAVIMTVTSLLIVLPINIYNGDEPVNTHKITFLQTTMINVSQQREYVNGDLVF
jgi:hypothetical protein